MKILVASSNPHKVDEIRAIFEEMNRETSGSCRDSSDGGPSPESAAEAEAPMPRIELVSLGDLHYDIPEPVEDGDTFEANAAKKARHYATAARMLCIADDSGLEVDALGGAPGVYSARYSGLQGPREIVDPANNRKLLEALCNVPIELRTARFVCAMALVTPDPSRSLLDFAIPASEEKKINRSATQVHRTAHVEDITLSQEVLALAQGTIEGRILLPEETADPEQPWFGRGRNGFGYDPLFYVPDRGCTSAELSPEEKNAISHRGNASRVMWRTIRHLYRQSSGLKQGPPRKKLPWR